MNYRLLPSTEWNRLISLFEGGEMFLPPPESATAAVAEDDTGEIQGVLFLQIQLHMEPLIIRSPRVNFLKLQETLHNAVADKKGLTYLCLADDPRVERMAEIAGFRRLNYTVWLKEV